MNQRYKEGQSPPKAGAVIIFGGAGFIGTHLLARLAATSDGPLISVDIRPPKRPIPGVDYRVHDVRDLSDFGVEGPVARIYNFAAVHTTPGHEPWEYYDTNVRGALEVTDFARRNGVDRLVFTSSISVYGPDETAKDEDTAPTPVSDYGRSKRMAELVHGRWRDETEGNRLVIVRPAVVFGLGEGGNFTRLARLLSKGFFVYPGRRDTIKSCIYVEDLIDWIFAAENGNQKSVLFNGAYTNRYTIEEIVETFRKVAFPGARTFLVPGIVLKVAAAILRPLSAAGLGIHPDRIEKLMVSTNVLPGWAESAGLETRDRLEGALMDWKARGSGEFL